jgi:hypothetical protein
MGRCRRPGSASRVAATTATTAGSCTPAGGCRAHGGRRGGPQDPRRLRTPAALAASRHRPALPLGRAGPGSRCPARGVAAAAVPPAPASGAGGPAPRSPAWPQRQRWERRRGLQPGCQLGPGPRPPRLDLPRPGPRCRRRPLAPPRRHQPQERHHPIWPAIRLLGRHPLPPTEAGAPHGYSRFRAYAVLEHGGDLRAAARALRETTR